MHNCIKYASDRFWAKYWKTLTIYGVEKQDVYQQTWMYYLELQQTWPTYPEKYLGERLLDWHRRMSHYNHRTKKLSPVIYFCEHIPDTQTVSMDVEGEELVQKVTKLAEKYDMGYVFALFMQDLSLKEIGQICGQSESTISKKLKRFFTKVRKELL